MSIEMTVTEHAPVHVFVAADGNAFMRDIACWVVEAAQLTGRTATLVDDRLPRPDGSVNFVVAPHEFYLLRDDPDAEVRRAASCSIPICTEQPGTPWFLLSLGFCVGSPLVLDINSVGLDAIEAEGFRARRLRLGGVAQMDRRHVVAERDIDVVFLGGSTPRRAAALARLGPVLWDRRSELRTFTFTRPLTGDEPGVVFGDEKYELLARSKVLVNLHRSDELDGDGYFEWARMVEAMANGCVVVSEPSLGHEPLRAGEHFVETSTDDLADTVVKLLADDTGRAAIADAAHRAVTEDLALADEMKTLLDLIAIEGLAPSGEDQLPASLTPRPGVRQRVSQAAASVRRTPTGRGSIQREHRGPLLPVFAPLQSMRRRVFDQIMHEMAHRRDLGDCRALIEHGDADHVTETATRAWATTQADVGVVVTLYNYGDVVIETLDSIVASTGVKIEIVIVDDHSSDDGAEVVRTWMAEHEDVAVLLASRAANRGLGPARNLGLGRLRADKLMVIDADNHVYPTCFERLSAALDRDPDAAFAYATLEAFGTDPGLRSAQGWHVPWLCDANYIDAQAMLRRSTVERYHGYRVDDSMFGWEDWDLWLRIADAGDRGIHVPEMLGRYRTQEASMISLTNLVAADLRADLVARYPRLPWPETSG
ncbi:MAG: glycosyltransferase [Ilumatobacter sp.]